MNRLHSARVSNKSQKTAVENEPSQNKMKVLNSERGVLIWMVLLPFSHFFSLLQHRKISIDTFIYGEILINPVSVYKSLCRVEKMWFATLSIVELEKDEILFFCVCAICLRCNFFSVLKILCCRKWIIKKLRHEKMPRCQRQNLKVKRVEKNCLKKG